MNAGIKVVLVIIFMIMATCNAFALTSTIELKDGSTVVGEIQSFSDGTYTVKSSFGVLTIPEENVTNIAAGSVRGKAKEQGEKSAGNSEGGGSGVPSDLTNAILSDSATLDKVMELGNDPDVKAILNDPVAMQAIRQGDMSVLLSNPNFMKLMTKPQIEDISEKVRKGK